MLWIYEVQLEITSAIEDELTRWMPEHMAHVVQAGGFSSASMYVVADPEQPKTIVIQYHASSREQISKYLNEHSPRLREDVSARFPQGFRATRRILRRESSVPHLTS